MFRIQRIESFDDPRLSPYRNMRAQFDHLNAGVFIAEGDKVLRRLLESPYHIRSVLLPAKWNDAYLPLLERRPEPIDLFVAEKEILQGLTGYSMYQGVLGLADVPSPASFDEILSLPRPRLFAAVDGLSNAENVGAIARNAAALGVQALLVGESTAHPYLRRAVRSSMGTIFRLPYLRAARLTETLRQLRQFGFRCVAAHPHADRRTIWQADFRSDCCIVLGSEGDGVRPEVIAECDESVLIPMANGVDSLNVAAAGAVFFAEAIRQRQASGSPTQNSVTL